MSRLSFYLIVSLLMVSGIALSLYRHLHFEVPWTLGEERQVWEVEALVTFNALGGPAIVDLALPRHQAGFRLLSQHPASPRYGLSFLSAKGARRAPWSIRHAPG